MKDTLSRWILAAGIILALSGCGTANQKSYLFYGPLPPEQFAHTIQQLDSKGIDYTVKNGNEIYLTKSESEKMRGGLNMGLSRMSVKTSAE
jgi:flagellar biosynthesis/type III secretory pathway M-ring protein FliF/YscJ